MSTKTELLALLAQRKGAMPPGRSLRTPSAYPETRSGKPSKRCRRRATQSKACRAPVIVCAKKADILTRDAICEALHVPLKLHLLDKVDSTNNYAKTLSELSLPRLSFLRSDCRTRQTGAQLLLPGRQGHLHELRFLSAARTEPGDARHHDDRGCSLPRLGILDGIASKDQVGQ